MPTIKPLDAYVADPDRAADIVAPAFDALAPVERRRFAAEHPNSYLHVLRTAEDFPEGTGPPLDELLDANRRRLHEMIETGLLVYNPNPGYYIYRIAAGAHAQLGLIAEVPVEAYEHGLVKPHEHTRKDKEDALTRYLEVVRASSSPVCLAYRDQPEIDELLVRWTEREPLLDFVADDGVAQSVWFVDDQATVERLTQLFAAVPALYLTDGHHRSAAAARYAASRRARDGAGTGREAYNYLLVALFPDQQLRILDYNRCVRGLNGHDVQGFVVGLERAFEVERLPVASPEAARPRRRRELALCLRGEWYRLRVRPEVVPSGDPVRELDLLILQEQAIGPLLGVHDPRSDPRIDYVPGPLGMGALESRCRDGWDVAFALYPTSVGELMAVADAQQVMPPKSTWFDPKLRSGTFVRLR